MSHNPEQYRTSETGGGAHRASRSSFRGMAPNQSTARRSVQGKPYPVRMSGRISQRASRASVAGGKNARGTDAAAEKVQVEQPPQQLPNSSSLTQFHQQGLSHIEILKTVCALNGYMKVFDEGVDRTPKPMLSLKPSVLHHTMPNLGKPEDSATPTSDMSDNFLERLSSTGFSRGMFSTSGSMSPDTSEEDDTGRKMDENSMMASNGEKALEKAASKRKEVEDIVETPEMLTEVDLEKKMHVTLEESDTIWLLDLPGVCVAVGSEEAEGVEQANARYKKLLESRIGGDKYNDGEMQTINCMQKTKEVQTKPFSTASVTAQASRWDIEDTYQKASTGKEQEDSEVTTTKTQLLCKGLSTVDPNSNQPSLQAKISKGEGAMGDGCLDRTSTLSTMSAVPNRDSVMSTMSMASMAPGLRESGAAEAAASNLQEQSTEVFEQPDPLSSLDGLLDVINLVDAAIMQNVYLDELILYRDSQMSKKRGEEDGRGKPVSTQPSMSSVGSLDPTSKGSDASSATDDHDSLSIATDLEGQPEQSLPKLELLWEWSCDVTEGFNVSCIAWNKVQDDLLAVGYGEFEFSPGTQEGCVAFWSLKNPEYPQWTFKTQTGVTALDFSSRNPSILAIGLYDGTVAMYDIQSKSPTPTMESQANAGKHSDPVWQVKWLDRGADRDEVLISISTDGRVTQWSITKGLEFTDLMKLKRVAKKGAGDPRSKNAAASNVNQVPFISRLTSGMAFDFSSVDPRIYIAGTEDGWIHKCSTSYSEQYLMSYQGHMGPVYGARWSKFKPGLFLSCSGDWTMKLWTEGRENALLTFTTSNDEINDVQWCPNNSTVFGCTTAGGRLEIWDISVSTMKPMAHNIKPSTKLTCLLFSEKSPVVVCGSNKGSVGVYRMFNIERREDSFAQHADRLDEVMRLNVMKAQAGM